MPINLATVSWDRDVFGYPSYIGFNTSHFKIKHGIDPTPPPILSIGLPDQDVSASTIIRGVGAGNVTCIDLVSGSRILDNNDLFDLYQDDLRRAAYSAQTMLGIWRYLRLLRDTFVYGRNKKDYKPRPEDFGAVPSETHGVITHTWPVGSGEMVNYYKLMNAYNLYNAIHGALADKKMIEQFLAIEFARVSSGLDNLRIGKFWRTQLRTSGAWLVDLGKGDYDPGIILVWMDRHLAEKGYGRAKLNFNGTQAYWVLSELELRAEKARMAAKLLEEDKKVSAWGTSPWSTGNWKVEDNYYSGTSTVTYNHGVSVGSPRIVIRTSNGSSSEEEI